MVVPGYREPGTATTLSSPPWVAIEKLRNAIPSITPTAATVKTPSLLNANRSGSPSGTERRCAISHELGTSTPQAMARASMAPHTG